MAENKKVLDKCYSLLYYFSVDKILSFSFTEGCIGASSNGRIPVSKTVDGGSNPSTPALNRNAHQFTGVHFFYFSPINDTQLY